MIKQLSVMILCLVILLSISACSENDSQNNGYVSNQTQNTSEPENNVDETTGNHSAIENTSDSEVTVMNIEGQKWDKMWDLWVEGAAESPYAELMTYQAEVNNGGHDQYFCNVSNTGDLEKEMSVLKQILPEVHKPNLEKAYEAYLALEENEDDEIAAEVLEQSDSVFWENESEINSVLEEYASKIEI